MTRRWRAPGSQRRGRECGHYVSHPCCVQHRASLQRGLLQSGSSACATSIFKNVQRFRCLFERLEKPASARIPHVFDGRRRPRGMKCIANVRDSAGSEEKEQPVPLMPLTLECRVGVGGGQRGGRTLEPGIPGNALSPWARAPAASNPSTPQPQGISNRPVNYPRPQGTS